MAHQGMAWCLCGDFNAVKNVNERKGVSERVALSNEIIGFNGFIDKNILLDLPIIGKKFTWFKSNGSAKSRLDRVLVNDEWLHNWLGCKQCVQQWVVSHHYALVVKSMVKD